MHDHYQSDLLGQKGDVFSIKGCAEWLGSGFLSPIWAGGAELVCTFFRWLFLLERTGLEVPNFLTFPNSL